MRQRLLLFAMLLSGLAVMALQADLCRGFTMGDPVEYANEAWVVVHGPQPETWPIRAKRPILMPMILAGSLHLFGSLFWLRLTVSLFGIATVWLTYLLAARLIDEDAGLLAAAILVTNPLWSSMSSQTFSEVPSTFFIMLCLVLLSDVRRPRSLFGAGCALGASILVRYQSIVMLVPISVLLLWQFKRRQVVAFSIGLLMLLAIQAFHDLAVQGQFWGSFRATLAADHSGLVGIHFGSAIPWWRADHSPWWHYFRVSHHWLTYAGPFALALGGWTVWRRGSRFSNALLLLPFVLTLGIMSAYAHKELRYLVVITPMAAIFCAATLHIAGARKGWLPSVALTILLGSLPLWGSYQILRQDRQRFYTGQADALRYLEQAHPGAVVATPSWSLCLPESRGKVQLLDLRLNEVSRLGPLLRRADFVLASDRDLRRSNVEKLLGARFTEVKRFPSRNETYLLFGVRR